MRGLLCLALLGCKAVQQGDDAQRDAAPASDAAVVGDADPAAPDAAPPPGLWPGAFWTEVLNGPPDPRSAAVIGWLVNEGGWGNENRFQIDFSIEVLSAGPEVPERAFEPNGDHYSPDCDLDPVPVPTGGALEGEQGYRCMSDGDCHLLVHQPHTGKLFEMWRADLDDSFFSGGCLAVWRTDACYGPEGRGLHCTSADAAGLPITPLLFTADEVAAGEISHAIRFILPNARIRHRFYVAPATHSTGAASGGEDAPPYGARLRLRADFPLDSLPSEGARVVARALQRHGMVLADAGQIALTAQSDRFTTAKWEGLLGPHDLRTFQVTDFEVMPLGTGRDWTGDCQRSEAPACR